MSASHLVASFAATLRSLAAMALPFIRHSPDAWHFSLVAVGFAVGFFALRPTMPA